MSKASPRLSVAVIKLRRDDWHVLVNSFVFNNRYYTWSDCPGGKEVVEYWAQLTRTGDIFNTSVILIKPGTCLYSSTPDFPLRHVPQELQAVLKFGPLNLKLQFVCGQCWRNGQLTEPDKQKKYCSAKARHPWVFDFWTTEYKLVWRSFSFDEIVSDLFFFFFSSWSKERRVVLVSSVERRKWIEVRPLPMRKPAPAQFEVSFTAAMSSKHNKQQIQRSLFIM